MTDEKQINNNLRFEGLYGGHSFTEFNIVDNFRISVEVCIMGSSRLRNLSLEETIALRDWLNQKLNTANVAEGEQR